MDRCKRCKVDWFDGGELAQLQLDHESRPKGRDELEAQRRSQQRTAEEREKFEALLAVLPEEASFAERLLHDLLPIALLAGSLVAVVLCCFVSVFVNFPVGITIAASLACGASLMWYVLQTTAATGRNLLLAAAFILVIETLWISFLLGAFAS